MRQLKVWHDDIRQAPEGWVWVRTNQAAIVLLCGSVTNVTEISLDHDLGLHELDPADYEKPELLKGSSEETGYHLVQAMCLLKVVPEKVTIHSWNPEGAARMASCFNAHGYDCYISPYGNPVVL